MVKKALRFVLTVLSILFVYLSQAQIFPDKNYSQGAFIWPLDLDPEIVANFGELRTNHYHMGLDCRTAQKQNLPVYAVADGYISRIKIEPLGFGRVIYINHPNGYTTLYAHLNDFFPELEQHVKEQQYKLKTWSIDLRFDPNQFPVEKCKFIAYSGNTGASEGPHVHFEIRNSRTEKVLNPTLFGMPLRDTIAPDLYRLAIYDRNLSTYEQVPKIYSLKRTDSGYRTIPPVIPVNSDKLSFGISAYDRCNGSPNRNGIFEATLFADEKAITGFQMDNIGYDETRYLNAHIDYKLRYSGGPMIQHLSQLPGYKDGIYKKTGKEDIVLLTDTLSHQIRIVVKDADGNKSEALFEIKQIPVVQNLKPSSLFADNELPLFAPGNINTFEKDSIFFYLPADCLYDSFRFTYKETTPKQGYTIYQLHNVTIPLHNYFPVTIKATTPYPEKMVIHRFANGRHDYTRADQVKYGKEDGWFKAWFRDLGSFQLMADTIPPAITPIGFRDGKNASKLNQLVFVITDNTEEIRNFSALLDGNWLRFSNDKGRKYIYNFDESCPPGEHELKITAEDQVGNITTKTYRFTR